MFYPATPRLSAGPNTLQPPILDPRTKPASGPNSAPQDYRERGTAPLRPPATVRHEHRLIIYIAHAHPSLKVTPGKTKSSRNRVIPPRGRHPATVPRVQSRTRQRQLALRVAYLCEAGRPQEQGHHQGTYRVTSPRLQVVDVSPRSSTLAAGHPRSSYPPKSRGRSLRRRSPDRQPDRLTLGLCQNDVLVRGSGIARENASGSAKEIARGIAARITRHPVRRIKPRQITSRPKRSC